MSARLVEALRGVLRWMPVYPPAADCVVGGREAHAAAINEARAALAEAAQPEQETDMDDYKHVPPKPVGTLRVIREAQPVPLTDEQSEAAFKAWHYKHGSNTQGIRWVDDLLRACWKAASGIGGKP